MTHGQTIDSLANSLGKAWQDAVPPWPPDVFAMSGTVLARTGAYVKVLRNWPPSGQNDWSTWIRRVGRRWRTAFNEGAAVPVEVAQWWGILRSRKHLTLAQAADEQELTAALLQLVAAADEASAGAGIAEGPADSFDLEALMRVAPPRSTLCRDIDRDLVRVLPKMRTPQMGISMSSLTGNLALVPTRDVDPYWFSAPMFEDDLDCLNLIVLPWPFEVTPAEFRTLAQSEHQLFNLPASYGVFAYERAPNLQRLRQVVVSAITEATRLVGTVHGLILPELALDETELPLIRKVCDEHNLMLITGVAGRSAGRARNYCVVRAGVEYEQDKHHRWCLDAAQIYTYGLGARLNPSRRWWEAHTPSSPRRLHFFAPRPWFTFSVLLCEDLARQDPVAQLVRTVGPNMVIALLMDGPQLPARWPGRYATVLAEDPGSSVLTVSSLGMVQLSRPPSLPPSRVVGLWRDASQGHVPLELPPGAGGIVLSISKFFKTEFLADGRDDRAAAGHPRLSGSHALYFKG